MSNPPKKRKTTWNNKYSLEFGFIKPVTGDESRAYCTVCISSFSIASGGKSDINIHIKTKKHQDAINAGSSSKKVDSFFKSPENEGSLDVAAKEITWAYHTASHNQSFKSNDCTSGLFKIFVDPKYSMARTKTVDVITNVIKPYIDKELNRTLMNAIFYAWYPTHLIMVILRYCQLLHDHSTLLQGLSTSILQILHCQMRHQILYHLKSWMSLIVNH